MSFRDAVEEVKSRREEGSTHVEALRECRERKGKKQPRKSELSLFLFFSIISQQCTNLPLQSLPHLLPQILLLEELLLGLIHFLFMKI
jgi:hypothetical protein